MQGRYPDFCAAMTVGFHDVRDELRECALKAESFLASSSGAAVR